MSDADMNRAARVSPPVTAQTYRRATVTSSESIQLPASFNRNFITIQAVSVDVHVAFKLDSAPTATASGNSTNSGEITPVANGSWRIPAGTKESFDLALLGGQSASTVVYMAHISSSTGGFIEFYQSSGVA